MAQELKKVELALDVALAGLKAVRAGTTTVAAFSEMLKKLDDTQLVIFADLSRMKLDMVKTIRDMKALV